MVTLFEHVLELVAVQMNILCSEQCVTMRNVSWRWCVCVCVCVRARARMCGYE